MSEIKPTGIYMFKWVDSNGCGTGSNTPYQYDLPKGNKPGNWHSKLKSKKKVEVCSYGFHCIPFDNTIEYMIYGPRLFLVEVSGTFHSNGSKVSVQSIRLVKELKYTKKINSKGCGYDINVKDSELPPTCIKSLIGGNDQRGKLGITPIGMV